MAGPKPLILAVRATAPKKKKNGNRCPAIGRKFAANAANTKNSAEPYRSAGFSRYKSRPASRWRSPSICDYSSVTRTAGQAEEGTLPLINTNNARQDEPWQQENELGGLRDKGISQENQADFLLTSGAGAGFGVFLFVIVRQC